MRREVKEYMIGGVEMQVRLKELKGTSDERKV
jgi:hypothetical protein